MSRVALVTGGAVRLGEAISRALAGVGYHVVVHAHAHFDRAQAVADEIGGVALQADLADRDQIDRLFDQIDERCGRLDVLVNNAAIFQPHPQETVPDAMWDAHVAINLTAPFRCCQRAAPRMRANGGGAIVNLIDVAAVRPYRELAHYAATKAGLLALTHGLAADWAPEIRVNGVAPGAALMPEWYDDGRRAARLERIPQRREPGAAAIAETVRFLVDGPGAITGEVIRVDGGQSVVW